MSGPKTSHYTLTPEQRRILEQQRRIRQQQEMVKKQKKDARALVIQADDLIQKTQPLIKELSTHTDLLQTVQQLRTTVMDSINRADRMTEQDTLEQWQAVNENLRQAAAGLTTRTHELEQESKGIDQQFRGQMSRRMQEGVGVSFADLGSNRGQEPYARKIREEIRSLRSLILSREQQSRLEEIAEKADQISDPDFLKNYHAMTVLPFSRQCRQYHQDYQAWGAEYDRKRMLYQLNAQTLGIEPEEIPFSPAAIGQLDEKLRETEAAIAFRQEQAYISRCVDEALQEMGYSLLGNREVVKRSGKKFRNELYLFDEGTAVNVTYSSDGQITMELGGIDTCDRIPTGAESGALASDMRTFCDDYSRIEQCLRRKGVITKRISILPPDAQYAQIINVSDYDLCREVSEYELKKEKKKTGQQKFRQIGE